MEQLAEMTLERLEEGDVTPFVITGVRPNGLFGDIGGIQAFIPIHEIRYGWIDNLYDEYKEGEHLLVEVQRIRDRKSTRLNSSHVAISYAVFCLKTKTYQEDEKDM